MDSSSLAQFEKLFVLLNKGQAKLTGCYSEKTGKTYDATVVLEDDGARTNYKLVFGHG